MSFNVSEIAKVLLDNNKKIFEAVSNTSAISEEAVASALSFEDMVNKQEGIFLNLKDSSKHLDKLSVSLTKEIVGIADFNNLKVKGDLIYSIN